FVREPMWLVRQIQISKTPRVSEVDAPFGFLEMGAKSLPLHLDHMESRHPAGDQLAQALTVLAIEGIGVDLPVVREHHELVAPVAHASNLLDRSVDVPEDVERLLVCRSERMPGLVERVKAGVDRRETLAHRLLNREA